MSQHAFQNGRPSKKQQQAEIAKLLQHAIGLVNSGSLSDARTVLQHILRRTPKNFDALHLLGMTEYHMRRYADAEQLLARAAGLEPRSADAHFNRGLALTSLGRYQDAYASYQRTTSLNPQHAHAFYNMAVVDGILNRPDQALSNYDKCVAIKKDFAEAWYNRGLMLEKLQRHEEAIDSHDRALVSRPGYLQALTARGSALHSLGRSTEALESHDEALVADPGHAQALNNRGMTLAALRRYEEALESYDEAVAANPGFADAFSNRGNVQRTLGRHGDAVESYDKALTIDPDLCEALNGRGAVLTELRDYAEALTCFARALANRPNFAEAYANRSGTWLELRQMQRAIEDADRALALDPNIIQAWLVRGHALLSMKRAGEAIESGEHALRIEPNSATAYALLGMCFAATGDIDGAIARFDKALAIAPGTPQAITPKIFALDFSDSADFEQHRDVRSLWWQHIGSQFQHLGTPHRNGLDPRRRIVVGYVSSDFRLHSAAMAFRPVLQYADKAEQETVCYSCSPKTDDVTEDFQRIADRWRDASQWSNERLADQIRQDGIDILVDLSGHTAGHRLQVVATKPAPIIVHGWGHASPPGLPTIDYVFSDPVLIPAEVRHLYAETIYDLPCVMTMEAMPADIPRRPLPAAANGFITFGVFNRISKISDSAAEVWSQILHRVPNSRLLIKDSALDDALVRDRLMARLAHHGLAAGRVELRGATSRLDHLAAFNCVDICLDPFPQNGGVSTWEALRMGVPVVAKLGNALTKRLSGAILTAVGLPEWVAESTEGYIEIAVRWAHRPGELARVREQMPGRLESSAAGNPRLYADAVGRAYRAMWQAYCWREAERNPATTGT